MLDPRLENQGQLVIVVNHRPWQGHSLDGTIGRISRAIRWGGAFQDAEYTYVDLFRRHRRTHRPLGPKEEFMKTELLRPIDESELDADQRTLVAHFDLVKLTTLAHRAKLRADNLAWEQRMLAVGGWAAPAVPTVDATLSPEQFQRVTDSARLGVHEMERLLLIQPPEGTDASRVRSIFEQHRENLIAMVVELTGKAVREKLIRKLQRAAK